MWATVRLAAPVALGMIPLGIAFGLLVLNAGLAWWWATVFSSVVFAGSLEFLLIAMVATAAPLAQVALTSLVVNSRHVSTRAPSRCTGSPGSRAGPTAPSR